MAQNDALSFYVKFYEDAQHNIQGLIRKMQGELKNLTIHLKAENINISGLEKALSKIQPIKVVDQTSLDDVVKKIEAVRRVLADAFNGSEKGAKFTGVLESLTQIKQEIATVSQALTELRNEISSLSGGISSGVSNAIVSNMNIIAEAAAKATQALNELNKAADPGKVGTPKAVNDSVNLDMAKAKIAKINSELAGLWKTQNASFKLNFDTGSISNFISQLQTVRNSLQNIVDNKGAGKRVDEILRDANYSSISKNAANEKKAVDEVADSVRRLKEALDSLKNVKGQGALRKDLNDQIRKLEYIGKNPAGVKMQQSEHVNAWTKELLARSKEVSRADQKDQENQARAATQSAKETANAQKTIQKEIDITKQKFNELYAAQTKLREKSFFSGVDASGTLNATQQKLTSMLAQIRQMENMQKTAAPKDLVSFAQSDQLKAWAKDFDSVMKNVREQTKGIVDSLKIDNLLGGLTSRIQALRDTGLSAANMGLSDMADKANQAADNLEKVKSELEQIQKTGRNSQALTFNEYMRTGTYSTAVNQADKDRQAIERRIRQEQQAVLKQNRSDATAEIKRLKSALKEINALQAKSPNLKINGVDKAIQDIQRIIALLEQAKERGRDINLIKSAMGDYSAQNMPQVLAQLTQNQQQATVAAAQHEQEQQRMAQAIAQATGEARQQSQVLSDLRSMALQYLSVWGAMDFVKSVAQVTGELELQQKSLEVIIGSAGKAQELFNDIKGMSQMSPFTFQNLMKTTKQLAAFGVETKDLYGTMKMLSDVGAGLDVDVQRLVLAYGHIKSAGVLSGIQRRQLETAGVGITAELAKLYNEQYRRAGSDERVTAEDVFKRIKDRQVTFEDVEKVFQRLTGPGGKFENMQLKQYETLGGKLRNLQNNYNIMLDEIGKAHMGLLMGGVNALNSLMENWQKWAAVIKTVGVALVAVKVAQAALGKSFAAHRAASLTSGAILREQAMLGSFTTGGFGGLWPNMRSSSGWAGRGRGVLDIDAVQKINDSQMSRWQKARAVMYKNVTPAARELLLIEQGFSPAYAANTKNLKSWQFAFQRLKLSAASFFATMRAGFAALLTNPMTWIFAAVAGITALVQKANEVEEQSKNIRKGMQKLDEDGKELAKTLKEVGDSIGYRRIDGVSSLDIQKLGEENPKAVIERLDQELQKFDPLYKGHLVDINAMQNDADKVLTMMDILHNQELVDKKLASQAGAFAAANASTGYQGNVKNLFGLVDWVIGEGKWDTFLEEAKETEEAYVDLIAEIDSHRDVINKLMAEDLIDIDKVVSDTSWTYALKEAAKIAEQAGVDYATALKMYITNSQEGLITVFKTTEDAYGNTVKSFEINTTKLTSSLKGLKSKMGPIVSQIASGVKDFESIDKDGSLRISYVANSIDQLLNTPGKEITNPEWREALKKIILDGVESAVTAGLPPEIAQEWRDNVFTQLLAGDAKVEADNFINDMITQGILTGGSDVPPEVVEELRKRWEEIIKKSTAGKDEETAERIRSAMLSAFEKALAGVRGADLKQWQKEIKDALSLVRFEDIKTKIGVDVGADVDLSEFIETTQKKFKEAKEKAMNLAQALNVSAKLGIKVDADVTFGSYEELKKLNLAAQLMRDINLSPAKIGNEQAKKNLEIANSIIDAIKPMMSIFEMEKATGFNLHESSAEAKKKADAAEKAREKAERARQKAAEDARRAEERQWRKKMENLRNEISMIGEVRSEYKKWEKDLSKSAALEMVKKNFEERGLYGVGKVFEPGDLDDVEDFATVLAKVEKKIKDLKNATKDPDRLDQLDGLLKDVAKAANENAYLIFSEGSEKALRYYSRQLDELTRKWNDYNSVIEKTGDKLAGMAISGLDLSSTQKGFLADDLESLAGGWFASALTTLDGALRTIEFDEVARLDDDGIEKYAKDLLGRFNVDEQGNKILTNAQQVQALIKVLKEYKKAMLDLDKRSVDAFNAAESSAVDYESQVKRINAALTIQENLIKRINGISKETKDILINRLKAQAEWDKFEKSNDYSLMMNNNAGMSSQDFFSVFERARTLLMGRLATGGMTPADYQKSIEELISKRSDYMRSRSAEILDFDAVSRMERAFKKAMTEFQRAAAAYQDAQTAYEKSEARKNELQSLQTKAVNLEMQARDKEKEAVQAELAKDPERAFQLRTEADELRAQAREVKVQAETARAEIQQLIVQVPQLKQAADEKREEAERAGDKVKKTRESVDDEKDMRDTVSKTIDQLNKFKEAVDFVGDVLASFGLDVEGIEDFSIILGSTANGASTMDDVYKAFGGTGPWGAVAGAALGLVSGIFQMRDASIQRRIDEIKFDTSKMSNTLDAIRSLRERQMGYDNGAMRLLLANMYTQNGGGQNAATQAMIEYYTRYSGGSGYQQELDLLKEQRDKLMEMYNLEDSKKKKSKEDLEDYKSQIAELDEQIMFFAQDLANELWGIDLKGWADQLGDALMTAFENGTSAASAFHDTVQDIMRSLVKNMLVTGIIEPALEKLQTKLFGKNGQGGIFDPDNVPGSMSAVLSELGNWFKTEGPALMDAANEFYNGADDMMKQTLGYGMGESDRSSNTVTSIQSAASEETMGVVAGYLARLSQDVSVKRIMQEMFVNGSWPSYIEQVTSANDSLTAIDRSTTAMMEMMRDGNGALYERVENMSRRLDNFANGIDRISIN